MRIIQQPGSSLAYRATSLVLTVLLVLPVWLLATRTLQFPAELRAGDLLFRLRGRMPVRSDFVIVAGDEKSVQALGPGPWPRRVFADAIRILHRAGAKVIVLDHFFAERDLKNKASDAALWKAMSDARNVHVPILYHAATAKIDRDVIRGLKALEKSAVYGKFTVLPETPQYQWLGFDPGVSDYAVSARGLGLSTTDDTADIDGVLRRTKVGCYTQIAYPPNEPATKLTGQLVVVPGLAVTAAEQAFEVDKQYISYDFRERMLFGGQLRPPVWAPINPRGQMTINYVGPPGSFATSSLIDVIQGKVPAQSFKDKVVLIGLTSPRAKEGDSPAEFLPTPYAPASPRVEITANALHSLLMRNYVRHEPHKTFPFLILLGLALGFLVPLFRAGVDAAVALVIFLLYGAAAVLALKLANLIMPVIPALLLVVLSYIVMRVMHVLLRAPQNVLVEE